MSLCNAVSTTVNANDFGCTPTFPALGTWVHVAAVKRGSVLTTYLDGVAAAEQALGGPSVGNAGPLYLGKDPWYPGLNGLLDEVRIYRTALSQAQVAQDMGVASNLIVNGGFELPGVSPSSYTPLASGATFGGWTVVGPGGVVTINTSFATGGVDLTAHDGAVSLDLTGIASVPGTGVAQTVTTVPGRAYTLSFWVGNVNAPGTIFGTKSTVRVLVDGAEVLAAVSSGGNATSLSWQQFTVTITPATASTTLSFINDDPADDNVSGLDDVVLR